MTETETTDRAYDVQDLSVGEIFDHALYLWRDNWKALAAIVVVIGLPCFGGVCIIQSLATPDSVNALLTGQTPDIQDPVEFIIWMGISFVLSIFFQVFALPFMGAALTHNAAIAYFDRPVPAWTSIGVAVRLLPKLMVCGAVYWAAVLIGSMMCVIPGIFAQCAFVLYVPILVLEHGKVTEVFPRSFQLMKGFLLLTFVALMAIGFINMPLGFLSMITENVTFQYTLTYAMNLVVNGFQAVFVTVIYASARCRHENLDLDLIANRVDTRGLTAEPAL